MPRPRIRYLLLNGPAGLISHIVRGTARGMVGIEQKSNRPPERTQEEKDADRIKGLKIMLWIAVVLGVCWTYGKLTWMIKVASW